MSSTLLVLLCLCLCAKGGRILSGDVNVDYANAGSMTQLSFSFMLSNSITATDFILIALPFPFHSQLIPAFPAMEGLSSPLGLLVTYQLMDNDNNVAATTYYARVLTDTIDSSNYFVQFYASDRKTVTSIPANQWYYITLKIQTSTPLTYQTSNSVLQIQLSTVSSVLPNAMVYDDNLAFNYFQLAASPSQLITVSATPYNFGSSGGYLLTQKVYSMYLDVTLSLPTYYYNQNLVLKFKISQANSFLFNGSCGSIAKTNAPTINALNSSFYTCAVDTINNIMLVTLTPQALALQKSFRFTVGMQNPATIAKSVSINVYALQQNCPIILGYGSASGVLSTNQLYVTYQEIFLGWGLRPDALLPFDARIYRGNAATPTYMPYNSLSLKFSVSQSTSAAVQLKVIISIPSEANAFVLPSGFSNNLPAFANKQVVCVVEYASSTTNRQIGCTGVGALSASPQIYYIGWKMFFPYDNYQSSINCSQFGLLKILTTTAISSSSYAYYLGRGDAFLDYVKSSSNFVVIGRNSTYINYMTTFPSINLVVLSSDFQEFLSQPQSIYINNRPAGYTNKTFNDVYVITQNLAFLTYINLFTDIYCAVLIPQNTDIVNGYGTLPLVATTTPKNTLTITTSNSQDWSDFTTNQNPLLSSVSASNTLTPGPSLYVSSSPQSLVFSTKAAYSSVTSFSSTTGTVITNNWGMMIMMNPAITLSNVSALTIKELASNKLTPSVTTVSGNTSYNTYTMITLQGNKSDDLQASFPITATKTSFGLYPFIVSPFSSIYADSNNMDIMIATVDGINGPQNKMTYNGFFLINSFSQTASSSGTIRFGFVNYQSSTALDGSKVPTLLRVKGTITNNQTALDSLVVFFDSLTPFFSNKHAGEVYCYNSDNTNPCRYYQGPSSIVTGKEQYNYQQLSRFQIPLVAPATTFNVLIPVTFPSGQTATNIYIAFQTTNTTSGFKSLAYVESKVLNTITATSSNSGNYGPQVGSVSITAGQSVSNLVINANSASAVTTNANANQQIGSAFSYFSQWDYFQNSTITGWNSYGSCYLLKYLYYYTNYAAYLTGSVFSSSYLLMTGVVCHCDSGGSITSAAITVSTGYLPSKWGITVPGFSAVSQQNGALLYLSPNTVTIGGSLTTTGITFPAVGPNMANAVGFWDIPLPVSLGQNVLLRVKTFSSSINLPFTFTGTCAVYYGNVKTSAGCNFASGPTQIDYTLTILEPGLLPSGNGFRIVHYGLTSNSSYNAVSVSLTCYSLLSTATPSTNDVIFSVATVSFPYNGANYIGASSLNLGSFTQWTQTKATYEQFNFTFTLLSKGLYVTNRIRFNLGQFALDNSASSVSPSCKVYTYDTAGSKAFSHDFAAVDVTGGFSSLQIWPAYNLLSTNLTYTIQCSNFLSTSSPTPISISAMVVNTSADLTGQLSQNTAIALSVLGVATTTCQITLTKSFSIPSINMEMNFYIISPGITMDSFLYLNFPSYYSNGLGADIKCYSPSGQIYCTVVDRFLTVQYMGVYASGASFTLTVTGVTMAINYNSGTFSFIFDNDNNPTTILASGTFTDSISSSVLSIQNFPTINILAFSQSSAYLRDSSVTLSITFYLPTSLSSIGLGQTLFLVIPATYYDVLRFVSPTCTLNILGNTLKNYVSTCTVYGMRIKMPFLDSLVLGSTYTLTIGGIINPTNPTSNVYRYSLEITDTTGTSILAKSYSINCNYVMPTYIANPITNMLNYYLSDGTILTKLNTMTNIQSTPIYIAPNTNISTSLYARNTYLSPLSSLQSNPSNIDLLSGYNPSPIRLSATASGVNYLYFSKTGDGNYYSNLPPLILTTSKNYFTSVSFIETSFNLPINVVGSNYSLIVTLPSSLYPMSEVDFTVTLSSAVGISMRTNPTVISFYPGKVQAIVALYINDATLWVVGATTNLVFTPYSSQTTYASGVSLPLVAVAAPGTPTATLTLGNVTLKSLSYSVTCSQVGKFIYHLSRSFAYNATACSLNQTQIGYWLAQSSLNSLRVTESYYQCDDIIGAINVAAGVANTLTIGNLDSSLTYQLDGFCETQGGVQTDLSSVTGSTTSNGGAVTTLNFYFTSTLTTAQKIKLVCALALNFQVDYQKVSTWDGYYCSELLNRRRLQQEENVLVNAPRMLTTQSYVVPVFFGVNTGSTNDTTALLVSAQANSTTLVNLINTQITGLPTLTSCTLSSAAYSGANAISGTFKLGFGPNFVYIYNIALTNNGLIYIIVGDPTVWTRAPVISEIKTGSGPNGLPPVFYRVLSYQTNDANSGNMAWTSLSGGPYTMYIVVSDNNPFDTANFGTISSYSIAAQVPSWERFVSIGILMLLFSLLM